MAAQTTQADLAHFRQILRVLLAIGSAIAATLVQMAQAGASLGDAAAAYERVSRTIRRIIMLAVQGCAPGHGNPAQPRATANRDDREPLDAADPVERVEAAERAEAAEFRSEIGYDLNNKTMNEIISEICRDLGLPPLGEGYAWTNLTPDEIAKLVVAAATSLMSEAAAPMAARGGRRAQPSPASRARAANAPPRLQAVVRDG